MVASADLEVRANRLTFAGPPCRLGTSGCTTTKAARRFVAFGRAAQILRMTHDGHLGVIVDVVAFVGHSCITIGVRFHSAVEPTDYKAVVFHFFFPEV